MSLPLNWVNRIFDKLALTYGQSFLRRWSDIDMEAVKADWAHELASFESRPEAISWALQHLPADPPNIVEFRVLACGVPPKAVPVLPEPPANPQAVAAVLERIAPILSRPKSDGREWARRILSGVERGEKRSAISVRFAKEALQ